MIEQISASYPAFALHTAHTSYAMRVMPSGHVEHLYYGTRITPDSLDGLCEVHVFPVGNSCAYSEQFRNFSMEDIRLEMSARGKGDIREPMVEIIHADGSETSDFLYAGFETGKGNPETYQLPVSHDARGESEWLRLELADKQNNLVLLLTYRVFERSDVITRSASLINRSGETVRVERLLSCCLDFDPGMYTLTTFGGAWTREMRRQDTPLTAGRHVNESVTGTSSNRANPFVLLWTDGCTEDYGCCYGFNLIYSGNHYEAVEISPYGKLRFVSGINPATFCWSLGSGGRLDAPEAALSFSDKGFNGLSRQMHRFIREHIVRGPWQYRERPVLLNSWEACYFQINEARLLELARAAKDTGIELLVMDDGWFGQRDDDTSSLGDWTPNPEKLPDGLAALAEKVNALGLGFGIWVEPEMVNENSDLYRAHPDWAMRIPGKPHAAGRNQMVLDLSRRDVQDYLIDALTGLLSSANIAYVKWDMNRIFSDLYSTALPPERQGEVCHRYILGLYRVLGALTEVFPEVLFEGCASGGNRFDLGMLCYFPQIWASDNTDAISRAEIQTGYSYGYPPSTITAHVSDVPNHQTLRQTSLPTRFHIAAFGILGYECNLCAMSPEELRQIREQITLYKAWRRVFQFGEIYRAACFGGELSVLSGTTGNTVEWTIVENDGSRAVSLLLQAFVRPNTPQAILHPKGLKLSACYRLYGLPQSFPRRDLGTLLNAVSTPPESFHETESHALPGERETHHMRGDVIVHAGVRLQPAFPSDGYREDLRFFPDFASRIYLMEAEENLS